MAVKIRLMRLGKIRAPYYRIVVTDARTKRDGRVIETVGKYHPKEEPSLIEVNSERVQYWLGVGAQPSEPVAAILTKTGDWQKFKGLPAPEQGLQTPRPRTDRKAVFEEAAREGLGAAEAAAGGAQAKPAKKTAKQAEAGAGEAAGQAPAEPAASPTAPTAEASGGQATTTSDQPTEA